MKNNQKPSMAFDSKRSRITKFRGLFEDPGGQIIARSNSVRIATTYKAFKISSLYKNTCSPNDSACTQNDWKRVHSSIALATTRWEAVQSFSVLPTQSWLSSPNYFVSTPQSWKSVQSFAALTSTNPAITTSDWSSVSSSIASVQNGVRLQRRSG